MAGHPSANRSSDAAATAASSWASAISALDRAGATLSTGERQRVQLARAVRNRTTGVLYVLDEPSIGLHPGQRGRPSGRDAATSWRTATPWSWSTMTRVILAACRPSDRDGARWPARTAGTVVCAGLASAEVAANPSSRSSAPYLSGQKERARTRERASAESQVFSLGHIRIDDRRHLHTVRPLGRRDPARPARGRDGRLRLRQDHARARVARFPHVKAQPRRASRLPAHVRDA